MGCEQSPELQEAEEAKAMWNRASGRALGQKFQTFSWEDSKAKGVGEEVPSRDSRTLPSGF